MNVRWAAALACAAALQGQTFAVTSHTLANGMKVLVQEDRTIPNVALHFIFRVGSRNEFPGATGLSHFFEHMMFNGTQKYGPGQFDIQMARHGGDNNAYTTQDLTAYTDWVPREALALALEMEADRIAHLDFDPAIVESERQVVISERYATVDNSHYGLLLEQLYATAFVAHPYRWPVLGWAPDIAGWTADDLVRHHRAGYAPNNCLVIAVGDVTAGEFLALARKYLEPIPRQAPPPAVRAREPAQMGERRTAIHKPAQTPLELIAWHVPASSHRDYWPLRVLVCILAEGRSSRLYRRLVDPGQLALSVGGWLELALDPGLLVFSLRPRGTAELEGAERALLEEVRALCEVAPAEAEVEKARNRLLTAFYRRLRTNSSRAETLGECEIYFGGFRQLFAVPGRIEGVSAADVRRAAHTWLTARNRTVATLLPSAAAGEVSE